MNELKKRYQRPEGVLIEEALQSPPKKSLRKLAQEVGLSEGRVRQIVNGYQSQAGQVLEIVGPAETVARLALGAGVESEALLSVGRADAAEIMKRWQKEFPERPDVVEGGLDAEVVMQELREWLREAPNGTWPGRPPTRGLMFWSTEQMLEILGEREQGHREIVAELHERIRRLKARVEGGEEDGDSAPTIGLVSDPGVDLGAAAKTGVIEEPGEFNN